MNAVRSERPQGAVISNFAWPKYSESLQAVMKNDQEMLRHPIKPRIFQHRLRVRRSSMGAGDMAEIRGYFSFISRYLV
jgi:hypothetical protein